MQQKFENEGAAIYEMFKIEFAGDEILFQTYDNENNFEIVAPYLPCVSCVHCNKINVILYMTV